MFVPDDAHQTGVPMLEHFSLFQLQKIMIFTAVLTLSLSKTHANI